MRVRSQIGIGEWAINSNIDSPLRILLTVTALNDNVIEFPLARRRSIGSCPHCGTYSHMQQVGRLLWAYCDIHEVRWVAADYRRIDPTALDRRKFRKIIEFLSSFTEIEH